MEFGFYKMSGGGNDFIIIDNFNDYIKKDEGSVIAEKLCKRSLSVGADGLILICPSKEHDFKWLFFNSDGSEAEMCGNGARCAARFAYLHNIADKEMSFETLAGTVKAEIIGENRVKVLMTEPFNIETGYLLKTDSGELEVSSLNTGVPHVLVKSDDIKNTPVSELGRQIRFHEKYSPAGTNVNFYQIISEDALALRTYERGVEGETLACGTGAVAAAIVANTCDGTKFPVKVQTSGGVTLKIHKENDGYFLEGEARVIYTGTLNNEALVY